MQKYVSLITRRADLSVEQFRGYYEKQHAPLALKYFPPALYQRNYPECRAAFDSLTEFDYPSDFDLLQVFTSEAGPALAADEANFIDRAQTLTAKAHLVAGNSKAAVHRSREMWLSSAVIDPTQLKNWWNKQSAAGVAVYLLEPYFCEQFPYQTLFFIENPRALNTQVCADFSYLCLPILSCPSAC